MSVPRSGIRRLLDPVQLPERHEISTTPAGIDVLYSPAPKRLYMLKQAGADDWTEVPSVTSILSVLDKPGLPWWGMKVGVAGCMELARKDALALTRWPAEDAVDDIVANLTAHQLTVNHVKNKAGDRGVAVHDALEAWANTGKFPPLDLFPDEQRGYARGVWEFLQHVPSAVPVASEVMVGSVKHGFAGRYDLRFTTSEEHEIVFKRTPKRGAQWATLKPGTFLADLKTSAGVYASHALQLEAYELASVECGYGATEGRGILHVTAEGHYEFRRAKASAEDFLAVAEVHRRFKSSKEWI